MKDNNIGDVVKEEKHIRRDVQLKKLVLLFSLVFIAIACWIYVYFDINMLLQSQHVSGFRQDEIDSLAGIPDKELFRRLVFLHQKKLPPDKSTDWLARHPESGQTFYQYHESNPVRPDVKRNKIYITLLGDFDSVSKEIVLLSAEYMRLYFNVTVVFSDPIPASTVPIEARRNSPHEQFHAGYILNNVLTPRLPDDALSLIAYSSVDLWPGEGWNYVFGLASIRNRVGVWSIARFGNPRKSRADYTLFLERSIKTGTHETGHMFSMYHCIAYECNMNGANNMREADRNPLWLCPVCLRKICWAVTVDPVIRYEKLAAFCEANNMIDAGVFFRQSIDVLNRSD